MAEPLQARGLSRLPGICHGFFTRRGGVSTGLYAALNCGLGSHDDPAAVGENRARVARALGVEPAALVTLYQVHSTTVVVLDRPTPRQLLPKADALVTKTPGLAVGAMAADCAPVLLADAHARVVAAAHAGWRGARAGVLEAVVAAMERLGAERAAIHAAIGPCISQRAYQVGDEFEAEFLRQEAANARFFARSSAAARPHFDLPGYVAHRLEALGLAAVEQRSPCTYESEALFFSYRRATLRSESDYGRQISAITVT